MREYLKNFLIEFDYPVESHLVFLKCYDDVIEDSDNEKELFSLLKRYEENVNTDYVKLVDGSVALANKAGVEVYTFKTVFHILLSKLLKEHYKEAGIPESYWFDSMLDIKYQTLTCKDVYGIWGTFCDYWFIFFFQLKRFAFGRLQIEIIDFNREYEGNGIKLCKTDKVFNIHIPRTGTKLDIAETHKSYESAMEFYKKYYNFECNVFFCHTWLLFPDNLQIVKPDSNIAKFIRDFDVFDVEYKDDYREVYRIFDVHYDGDVNKLPQDNSLRRGYVDWIKKGKKIGIGCGIHIHK